MMVKLFSTVLCFGILCVLFTDKRKIFLIKFSALFASFLVFLLFAFHWVFFDNSSPKLQFVNEIAWLSQSNINATFGVDGISLFFIFLSVLLIPLCLLSSWCSISRYVKEYCVCLLSLEILLILVFSVSDI